MIKEQQNVADSILKKLSAIDENVILAGGAPRDWYFNHTATDLDFYLKGNGWSTQMLKQLLTDKLGTEVVFCSKYRDVNELVGLDDDDDLGFLRQNLDVHLKLNGNFEIKSLGDIDNNKVTDYGDHNDILAVFNANVEYQSVQIIIIKDNVPDINYIRHFSNSLCEITYDKNGLHPSTSFELSVLTQLMTIKLKDSTASHINKMMIKFPDYKLYFI